MRPLDLMNLTALLDSFTGGIAPDGPMQRDDGQRDDQCIRNQRQMPIKLLFVSVLVSPASRSDVLMYAAELKKSTLLFLVTCVYNMQVEDCSAQRDHAPSMIAPESAAHEIRAKDPGASRTRNRVTSFFCGLMQDT